MTGPVGEAQPLARRLVSFPGSPVEGQLDHARIEAAGIEFVPRYDLWNSLDEDAVTQALDGAWAVIAGGEPYTRRVIGALPVLRAIIRPGLGYDMVDVDAATDLGVLLLNTPDTIEPAVAELAVALILATTRRILPLDAAVRSGKWRPEPYLVDGLVGATVGLVGLGRIGSAVARRLAGFDCRLVGTDPAADGAEWAVRGVTVVDLETLLRTSDVISLHVPLQPSTWRMIGEHELALMRSSAILVNTSRGEVVDESALARALASGAIAGAGIDAFEREPLDPESPLIGLPNVVLTGHVGWATHGGTRAMHQAALDTAWRLACGELPTNAVNPEALAVRAGGGR